MTIIQDILRKHTEGDVRVGEFVMVRPDHAMLCDTLGPIVLERVATMGGLRGISRDRIHATCGRSFPARDVASANALARYHALSIEGRVVSYGTQRAGVLHNVIAEAGVLRSGEILIGTDSHTMGAGALGCLGLGVGTDEMVAILLHGQTWIRIPPSIRIELRGRVHWPRTIRDVVLSLMARLGPDLGVGSVLEFIHGPESGLRVDDLMVLCTHAAECGAVSAIASLVPTTEAGERSIANGSYAGHLTIDIGALPDSLVACPHDPFNIRPLAECVGIPINYCLLGTCSGGGIQGLREAARVLQGRRIASGVTLMVVPQSSGVYSTALEDGTLRTLVAAGATVTSPTCGPCLATHSGVLSSTDRCVSTANRNFKGRMGSPGAEIYLASAPVVATAALYGRMMTIGEDV